MITFTTGSSAGKSSGQDSVSVDRGQDNAEETALSKALFLPLIAVDQIVVSDRTEALAPATPEPAHDNPPLAVEEEAVEASFLPLISR